MSDRFFKKSYKFSKANFQSLVDAIYPLVPHRSNAIPVAIRLAVTIRWLVGASHVDLIFGYNIGEVFFFYTAIGLCYNQRPIQYISKVYSRRPSTVRFEPGNN